MTKVTLAGLWAHKRRLVGMLLAVFLGVAFLAGTLVLGDTMRESINGFFVSANAGTDVVVRNATQTSDSPGDTRGPIDASIVDKVRAVDGVAVAQPTVQGFAQIVRKNGEALSVNGPRTAGNWIADPELNPYHLVEGRPPRADGEVVLNRGAAQDAGLRVGDATTVLAPKPVRVTVVGVATFGASDAFGGTSYVGFTMDDARRYLTDQPAKVTTVAVKAAPGVSQDELVRRIAAVLPAGAQAISGTRLTDENFQAVDEGFLTFFRAFLSIFAGVALLVAAISIHNTFAIIVAQRTRESALLRAIGASRRQVLTAVILEALVVAAIGTALGLAAGLGLAALLKNAFAGLGFDLPATKLVFTVGTGVISAVVGILATLVAAITPALQASRVPPLAALRDVAIDRSGSSRTRAVIGGVLAAGGVGTALTGVSALTGVGAVLLIAGVVTLGPAVAPSVTRLVGAPAARLRGITGSLARRNAMRNPRRTAGAASALMIGVGVVTLFTVFAASQTASIDAGVGDSFTGDLAVTASRFGNGGVSPQLAADLAALPSVQTAVGVLGGPFIIDGQSETATAADPAKLSTVVRVKAALTDQQIAVSDDVGWKVGRQVTVGFGDGATERFTVGAVYDSTPVIGDYLMSERAWIQHVSQPLDLAVYIRLRDSGGRSAVEAAVRPYGAPTVQDRQEFIDASTQSVRQLLNVVYVMLVLAIVIALMGIANTLSLSVHERTRELGLLRAVGATRPQVRSMVRWESVITALFGTVGGLALGTFLGWTLVRATDTSFSAPPTPLAVVLIGGTLAGVLAGLPPARRAARTPAL